MLDTEDDIVAIASPAGAAARGIVRLSGPRAMALVRRIFQPLPGQSWPGERAAALTGQVTLAENASLAGRVLLWPTHRSYTRQPAAELHLPGSPPVLQMVVDALCRQGARLAAPGEFTLRAFLSGRLDLTQAEAVLAVIDAESQQQLDVALQQLAGGLARPLTQLRQALLQSLAELEAGLDFVEEDIEFISQQQLRENLEAAQSQLQQVLEQIESRDRSTAAATVVLMGLPNAGKSSLFNWLLGRRQAIVTEVAGTTTDYLSAECNLAGTDLLLIDTAGLEEGATSVARQAQLQGSTQHLQARLRLICLTAEDFQRLLPGQADLDGSGQGDRLAELRRLLELRRPQDLLVVTKTDLVPGLKMPAHPEDAHLRNPIPVSTVAHRGRETLERATSKALQESLPEESVVGSTVQRAFQSLQQARQHLAVAQESLEAGWGEEIVAAEIRDSLEALGLVVGTVYTDDILDIVFGKFCIGK